MNRSLQGLVSLLGFFAATAVAQDAGVWSKRIEDDASREPFTLTARKPSYILLTYMEQPNQAPYEFTGAADRLQHQEVKFQLSFQTKMADDLFGGNGDLWFGYTQVSWWQLFNHDISAPFRETNYEPEVHLSFLTDYRLAGFRLRAVDAGFVHQSNGRAEPLSRSWNRVFADFQAVHGDFALSFKPWLRIKEDPATDDNPDIRNYLGSYELRAFYNWRGQIFTAMGRNLLDGDHRYNLELGWSFPIAGKLRGMVQWYKGYGESLIDYNYNMNRIGVGVLLTDWL
ncbi:MAG TPA: phospholipase A [Burkholderiales bacterium]